ncbi:MAG TPA: helix-turn-helix transcriptional regulator [Thermoanaerobacterales bacterium]|jgi:transcriptional regulator with XRE-family HTH domain|nr:helix-turn-helix transcriptional regulator [Thermoanaerobacterales bacterium]
MEDFISRLKYLRTFFNLSQPEFAKIINVSRGNVGDWETGRSKPTVPALITISNRFNISIDWLLKGIGSGPGQTEDRLLEKQDHPYLTTLELSLIDMFRKLDLDSQNLVIDFVRSQLKK